MSFLIGGDADKRGNYYENKFLTFKFAELLNGEIKYIQQETYHQDDEKGVDILVTSNNGCQIFYQCKSRNGTKTSWDISDLEPIIKKAFTHTGSKKFVLVSPLVANTTLQDLCERSLRFSSLKDFEENALGGENTQKVYFKIKTYLPASASELEILQFFQNFEFFTFPDDSEMVKIYLNTKAFIIDCNKAYALLCNYVETNNRLASPLSFDEIHNYLSSMDITFFTLLKESDCKIIKEKQKVFINALNRQRINNKDYERTETMELLSLTENNKFTIVCGDSNCGKSAIIKQLCDKFIGQNKIFLPLNFSVNYPSGDLLQYSKNLGFSSTLSMSLSNINKDSKCYLIIDQMDAIRWGSVLDHNARNLCSDIIKESLIYDNVNVILIARKINVQNIEKIIEYEISAKNNNLSNISKVVLEIKKVNESFLKSIIPEYNNLSQEMKKILTVIGNIKYYLDIKSKDKNKITTTNALIKTYLDEKLQQLQLNGYNAQQLIQDIVQYMDLNKVLSIQKVNLNKYSDELINEVKNIGIIVETSNNISFMHQSIFDFYIAQKLFEKYEKDIAINLLIRKLNNQPIENYETIKQFLELLLQDSNKFCENLIKVLFDNKISFIIKRLAIDFALIIDKNYANYFKLFDKLINNKKYGLRYLNELAQGKEFVFKHLIENGMLEKLIISKDKKNNIIALNLILSLQNSSLIETYLEEFINLHNSKEVKENIIYKIDDLNSSDYLFDLKINLLSEIELGHFYIQWDKVIKSNINRAYKYLEFLFKDNKYTEIVLDVKYNEYKKEINKLISIYSKDLIELIKSYFKLSNSKYKILYYEEENLKTYNVQEVAIFLYSIIVPYLEINAIWQEINDEDLKYIAFLHLNEMDKIKGTQLLNKIIENQYISKQNFHYNLGFIFKLQKFISMYIENVNLENTRLLEKEIIGYRNPKLLDFAKRRIEQRKQGLFYNFFEEEQKVLLSSIPEVKLTSECKNYIRFLNRKFVKPEMFNPNFRNGVVNYNVISGINKNNNKLTKKAWIKLLKSKNVGKTDYLHKEKVDRKGNVFSCDEHYIKQFIYDGAYANRPLFVNILLNESNLRDDFIITVFSAISNKFSNKNCEIDCPAEDILKAYKKYFTTKSHELLPSLINFAQHYNYFDDWLVNNLLNYSKIQNKDIAETAKEINDFSYQWQKHFNNNQSGSIVALSHYLWGCNKEPDWLDIIFNICINSNTYSLAIAGVDMLCPFYKINEEKCVSLLIEFLNKFPNLLEGVESWKIIDASIPKKYINYNKTFKDIYKMLSVKSKNNLLNRCACYYVFYNIYKKQLKKMIKEKFDNHLSFTCMDLILKYREQDVQNRIEKVIRLIIKWNPTETNNFLFQFEKCLPFFKERNLINPIIKHAYDKYDREIYVHTFNSIIVSLPSIIEYKQILFSIANKYLKNKNCTGYYATFIIQWFIRLYWESKNSKLRKKCLKNIENFYKKYLFNVNIVNIK